MKNVIAANLNYTTKLSVANHLNTANLLLMVCPSFTDDLYMALNPVLNEVINLADTIIDDCFAPQTIAKLRETYKAYRVSAKAGEVSDEQLSTLRSAIYNAYTEVAQKRDTAENLRNRLNAEASGN